MNDPQSALVRLLVAALVGMLIGLDRERAVTRKAHKLFAGIRTFPLIALAGAVPMLLLPQVGPALLIVSFVAVGLVAIVSYVRSSATGDFGATTEMAALATFLLGALAGSGQLIVAAATGVALAVLLVAKPRLERFSRQLPEYELAAALELAVVSVIVLPLVPNRGYGPWELLNPFDIWLVVVLVSGLSFCGFVTMRLFGQGKGMLIAGAVGAMVSSTAVTVTMARQSATSKPTARLAAAAAVLASAIMGVRVALLAGFVNPGILPRLLPVVIAMGAEGLLATQVLRLRAGGPVARSAHKVTSPTNLTTAIAFAAIYTLVLLLVHAAQEYVGPAAMYATAALSSLADVDAVAIAFAHMGDSSDQLRIAALGVTIALVTNTLSKLAIGLFIGHGQFRRDLAVALSLMAVVGALCGAVVAWM